MVLGNTLYLGGFFGQAGPVTGNAALIDPDDGLPLPGFPEFGGTVNTAAPDGRGGWIVGGTFNRIDGRPHGGLARLDSDHHLFAWDPAPDGVVLALTVVGDTVFVGGQFQHVLGIERPYIAAFRVSGGELLPALPAPDGEVRALLATPGRLFIGGDFNRLGTSPRRALAALDLRSGAVSDWDAGLGFPGYYASIRALAYSGGTLLAGGLVIEHDFYRRCLAAIDLASAELLPWNPPVTGPFDNFFGDPYIAALVIADSSVYIGGHFSWVSGIRRGGLAEVSFPGGGLSAWNPDPEPWFNDYAPDVTGMVLRHGRLHITGTFEAIGDSSRNYMAAVDAGSGALLPWNPGANFNALTIGEAAGSLLVGGEFQGVGQAWNERRHGLAAFDRSTGALKPWDPRLSGLGVEKLATYAGRIYVAGYFDGLGGQPRYCLGAVDTLRGDAVEWDPGCNGPVVGLRVIGDTLYAGGGFSSLSGQPRSCVGAFDLTGGTLSTWAPLADGAVWAFEPMGEQIFIGGDFYRINGVSRPGIAAVDVLSGALGNFDCELAFAGISSLIVSGDTLYAGGAFSSIGGKPHLDLAALSVYTGTALDWTADGNGQLTAMVKVDSVLYVGGTFASVNGQSRLSLAAVSARTGAVLPWSPGLNGTVWGMSESNESVLVHGGFTSAFGSVRAGFMELSKAPPAPEPQPPPPPPPALAFSAIRPNPATDHFSLELAVASAGSVSLELYDIQGRLVAPLLSGRPIGAGRHRLNFSLGGVQKGLYLCRITAGGTTTMQKLVVIR